MLQEDRNLILTNDDNIAAVRVLVVAGYPTIRYGLQAAVDATADAEVAGTATDLAGAVDGLKLTTPDLILADVDWTSETLEEIGWLGDLPPVLLLVETPEEGVDAVAAEFRGVLLRDASVEEIAVAMTAVYQGLTVLDPRIQPLLRGAGSSQPGRETLADVEPLTAREMEVLELIAEGLPNKGIAAELGISEHTVKFHVGSILTKLGAASRAEALTRAMQAGVLSI